jgi:diguanylate cyclase
MRLAQDRRMTARTVLSGARRASDRQQALRITRNLMAVGTSLLVILLLVFYRMEGYIAKTPFVVASSLILGLCVGFYLVFRSGVNLRFADPSLTFAQVASAVATLVYVNFHLVDGRGAFLLVYIMAMVFAVFRLTTRQLHFIVLPVIAAHAAFIVFRADATALRVDLLHWIVLTVVLLWFAQLGGYISDLRRRLRALTMRDELTGAFSRRYVTELLQVAKSRADRHGESFCVALLDLDRFKSINDRFGHAAGDDVLKAFAAVVAAQIRDTDHFGRYGGEEFMLVLTRAGVGEALPVAERIRAATAAYPWGEVVAGLAVSVSIGVAQYRRNENADALVQRADAALYEAKRAGRDRVVTAGRAGNPAAVLTAG